MSWATRSRSTVREAMAPSSSTYRCTFRSPRISRDRGRAASRASNARGLDWTLEANLGISRPLTERTRIELGWRVIRNRSNFEIYDYDRSIWGIYLRTQLD